MKKQAKPKLRDLINSHQSFSKLSRSFRINYLIYRALIKLKCEKFKLSLKMMKNFKTTMTEH